MSHRRRVFELEPSFWWYVGTRDLVRSYVPSGRRLRILDAGCGTGMLMRELSRQHEVVGIDRSREDLSYTAERGPRNLAEATIEALPFADETFDVVLSLDVLTNAAVENEAAALGELRRVLRRGGRLVLNLAAYELLRSEHDLVVGTGHRYTRGEVRRKLVALGLVEERATYRVSFLLPFAAAARLFGRVRLALTRGRATPRTEVRQLRPLLNEVLKAIQLLENAVVRRWDLPAGLSIFCVHRRPPEGDASVRAAPRSSLRERLSAFRPLVRLVQFAVTGERVPRRHRMLAQEIARGPHGFVLDLGCGSAPLLRFVTPGRYVGVDEDAPALAAARAEHSRPGWELLEGNLAEQELTEWRGADVVVLSSVSHHMDDAGVHRVLARVFAEVAPKRVLLQDAEATGPLGPLVRYLDAGRFMRRGAELRRLLEEKYRVTELWRYDNPLRSFRQFLFEVRP